MKDERTPEAIRELMGLSFKDLKVGERIKFIDHCHDVCNWGFSVTDEMGTVTMAGKDKYNPWTKLADRYSSLTIEIKLDVHHEDLDEWNNCLIWTYMDDDSDFEGEPNYGFDQPIPDYETKE